MSTIINDLTGEVVTNNKTIARGAFGSICKGTRCGEAVAIKTLDLFPKTESEKKAYNKILRKELTVWARLEGPNIVPLLGYIRDTERGIMSMVCPWMEKGSLNDYLEVNPDISSKRRCQIIKDVANGLTYLHVNHNVIHGDLSGGNILFDSKDKAYLSDFGLAQMAPEMTRSMTCSSSIHPGNILYRPPEHFTFSANTALSKPSKPGDIYSFGSIIFQVLSGRQPYYTKNRTAPSLPYISYSLGKAKTWRWPKRPASISDDSHWGLIQACWSLVPEERPAIQCLADRIDDLYEAANDANSESRIPMQLIWSSSISSIGNIGRMTSNRL
ncbi:kinase-like domain-containing protein [Flammula alnicola]|nr:kinase-like domain-containing protein [Flammula alnicola]